MLGFGDGDLDFGNILFDRGAAARIGKINFAAGANGLIAVSFDPFT